MDNIFRQIHIGNCKYVNKGGCATVYRLNEDKIVKVFDRGSTLAIMITPKEPMSMVSRPLNLTK